LNQEANSEIRKRHVWRIPLQGDEPGSSLDEQGLAVFCANAEEISSSLAIDELFMREAHLKFHMKYPRYEVDSTCLSSRHAVPANKHIEMYIALCLHDYDSKNKEILYLTATEWMTIATRASRSAASATESTGSDPFRLPYV